MSTFKYTLASGATFTVTAPAGTTQAAADKIFYSQVAAGTFVGYNPGDTLTSAQAAINSFGITRLQRGTAGVNDQTVISIVSGQPIVASLPSGRLALSPIQSPINDTAYIQVTSNPEQGLLSLPLAPVVPTNANYPVPNPNYSGGLNSQQVQALMAQLANIVKQPYNVITQTLGLGKYGFNSQQLERVGYVKPGYSDRYCRLNSSTQANPSNFVSFMKSPSPWTGLNGVESLQDILTNEDRQNQIQLALMQQSYSQLVNSGVIIPARAKVTTPSISTGQVYSSSGQLVQTSTLDLVNSTSYGTF